MSQTKTLGLDCSTKSMAWSIFEDKELLSHGEILFTGKDTFARLHDGQAKVHAIRHLLKTDIVYIEGATYVQNKHTVILLAYCFGAILAALHHDGVEIKEITPSSWQSKIGNKMLTQSEKDAIIKANPRKTASWYKNAYRLARKEKTKVWVLDNFGVTVVNDNCSDAIAIGAVGAGYCD